ncbi:hypothetical protein CC86DRAFT_76644 [Ophiobolus disseminans]|uniref:Uncharacterized protein n=1 Tax=Ophiobolus disseminans TaxID=1469910 RepID=A0A6A6ZPW0_9PLEO|nr:hypothetical protein CC86DRAFT_76644 [Ophiobolus disseminans]
MSQHQARSSAAAQSSFEVSPPASKLQEADALDAMVQTQPETPKLQPVPSHHVVVTIVAVEPNMVAEPSLMLDLPPPSSPNSQAALHTISFEQPLPASYSESWTNLDRYADFVDRIEDRRWKLRDARERLHGARVRLGSQRKTLGATRANAVSQAGVVFDKVKRYLLERGIDLPQEICYAIEDADILRDRLGEQEHDFEEAEEKYNLDEWAYTEEEKQFVDSLYASTPIVPPPPTSANTQAQGFSQPYFGPSVVAEVPPIRRGPGMFSDAQGGSLVHTKATGPLIAGLQTPPKRSGTSVSLDRDSTKLLERMQPIARPYSESDLTQVRWTDTRGRIEGWLLDALEHSNLQKVQLRNHLSSDDLDDDNWWQLVVQHWKSNSPGSTVFHTGDTTASPTTTGHPGSVVTMARFLGEAGLDDPEAKPLTASPLVSLDRVVDALEDVDFPSNIKPSDLVEPPSRHVTFEARSPSAYSMSTQPTSGTRTSSRLDCSSMSSIEEDRSYTTSGDVDTIRHGYRPYLSQETNTDGLAGVEEHNDETPATHPDSLFDKTPPGGPSPLASSSSGLKNPPLLKSSEQPPLSNEAELDAINEQLTLGPQTTTTLSTADTQRPQWSESFVQVLVTQPWYFPLLRLTPSIAPRKSFIDQKNHLRDIPFVSMPGIPLHLPGPSRLPGVFADDFDP